MFRTIETYPDRVSGATVVARLIDGLGFRYHWATAGLRPEDRAWRAAPDTMSIGEIEVHVWGLANWMCLHLLGEPDGPRPSDLVGTRLDTLQRLLRLRDRLAGLTDPELGALTIEGHPFWHVVNGPLADALTHTGQISHLRRAAGNPVPAGVNVFTGAAPTGP